MPLKVIRDSFEGGREAYGSRWSWCVQTSSLRGRATSCRTVSRLSSGALPADPNLREIVPSCRLLVEQRHRCRAGGKRRDYEHDGNGQPAHR